METEFHLVCEPCRIHHTVSLQMFAIQNIYSILYLFLPKNDSTHQREKRVLGCLNYFVYTANALSVILRYSPIYTRGTCSHHGTHDWDIVSIVYAGLYLSRKPIQTQIPSTLTHSLIHLHMNWDCEAVRKLRTDKHHQRAYSIVRNGCCVDRKWENQVLDIIGKSFTVHFFALSCSLLSLPCVMCCGK